MNFKLFFFQLTIRQTYVISNIMFFQDTTLIKNLRPAFIFVINFWGSKNASIF